MGALTLAQIIEILLKGGISLTVVGFVMYMFWFIVKHLVLKISEATEKMLKLMDEHKNDASRIGKFVMDEHQKMIELLNKINGKSG